MGFCSWFFSGFFGWFSFGWGFYCQPWFVAGAFSYIENLMSEASLHQGQDQKTKDMMNPTAQENSRQPFQVTRESSICAWSYLFKPRICTRCVRKQMLRAS